MNQKILKRAFSLEQAAGTDKLVRLWPYVKEVFVSAGRHNMLISPRYGKITRVIQSPSETSYGSFEVLWCEVPDANGVTKRNVVEILSGDKICFYT